MTYAQRTRVPVDRSKTEIERTLTRYGAKRFLYASEGGKAIIMFEAREAQEKQRSSETSRKDQRAPTTAHRPNCAVPP